MDGSFYNPDDNVISYQLDDTFQRMDEIYKAFVNAMIPRTPDLAEEFGRIQYYGALDLYTDEYLILSLNSYYFPITYPTAEMLELAAEQLVLSEGAGRSNTSEYTELSTFGVLAATDRLLAVTLLEQLMVNTADLPIPFRNNPGFMLYITNVLSRFTLMGYYSEWSGYGSTRLDTPNQRKLEFFPISWEQVGYPGPSLGYRALRVNTMQNGS